MRLWCRRVPGYGVRFANCATCILLSIANLSVSEKADSSSLSNPNTNAPITGILYFLRSFSADSYSSMLFWFLPISLMVPCESVSRPTNRKRQPLSAASATSSSSSANVMDAWEPHNTFIGMRALKSSLARRGLAAMLSSMNGTTLFLNRLPLERVSTSSSTLSTARMRTLRPLKVVTEQKLQ